MTRKRSRGKKINSGGGQLRVYSGKSYFLGSWIENSSQVDRIDQCDIVVMPGGSDWTPWWYGQTPGIHTRSYIETDIPQMETMLAALKHDKLIVGICRGLQGIHIVAGGKLIQHVNNHNSSHHRIIDTLSGEEVMVNSMHHQMVDLTTLPPDDYALLAYVSPKLSSTYLNDYNGECYDRKNACYYRNNMDFMEPEAVYYNKIHAIGFQYHPESLAEGPALKYTNSLIREVIDNKDHIFREQDQYALILELEEKIDIAKRYKNTTNPQKTILALPQTTKTAANCCETKTVKNEANWYNSIKEW